MNHHDFSAKGGKAGQGESKRRSPAHYAKLVKLSLAARRARQWAKENGTTLEAMAGDAAPAKQG